MSNIQDIKNYTEVISNSLLNKKNNDTKDASNENGDIQSNDISLAFLEADKKLLNDPTFVNNVHKICKQMEDMTNELIDETNELLEFDYSAKLEGEHPTHDTQERATPPVLFDHVTVKTSSVSDMVDSIYKLMAVITHLIAIDMETKRLWGQTQTSLVGMYQETLGTQLKAQGEANKIMQNAALTGAITQSCAVALQTGVMAKQAYDMKKTDESIWDCHEKGQKAITEDVGMKDTLDKLDVNDKPNVPIEQRVNDMRKNKEDLNHNELVGGNPPHGKIIAEHTLDNLRINNESTDVGHLNAIVLNKNTNLGTFTENIKNTVYNVKTNGKTDAYQIKEFHDDIAGTTFYRKVPVDKFTRNVKFTMDNPPVDDTFNQFNGMNPEVSADQQYLYNVDNGKLYKRNLGNNPQEIPNNPVPTFAQLKEIYGTIPTVKKPYEGAFDPTNHTENAKMFAGFDDIPRDNPNLNDHHLNQYVLGEDGGIYYRMKDNGRYHYGKCDNGYDGDINKQYIARDLIRQVQSKNQAAFDNKNKINNNPHLDVRPQYYHYDDSTYKKSELPSALKEDLKAHQPAIIIPDDQANTQLKWLSKQHPNGVPKSVLKPGLYFEGDVCYKVGVRDGDQNVTITQHRQKTANVIWERIPGANTPLKLETMTEKHQFEEHNLFSKLAGDKQIARENFKTIWNTESNGTLLVLQLQPGQVMADLPVYSNNFKLLNKPNANGLNNLAGDNPISEADLINNFEGYVPQNSANHKFQDDIDQLKLGNHTHNNVDSEDPDTVTARVSTLTADEKEQLNHMKELQQELKDTIKEYNDTKDVKTKDKLGKKILNIQQKMFDFLSTDRGWGKLKPHLGSANSKIEKMSHNERLKNITTQKLTKDEKTALRDLADNIPDIPNDYKVALKNIGDGKDWAVFDHEANTVRVFVKDPKGNTFESRSFQVPQNMGDQKKVDILKQAFAKNFRNATFKKGNGDNFNALIKNDDFIKFRQAHPNHRLKFVFEDIKKAKALSAFNERNGINEMKEELKITLADADTIINGDRSPMSTDKGLKGKMAQKAGQLFQMYQSANQSFQAWQQVASQYTEYYRLHGDMEQKIADYFAESMKLLCNKWLDMNSSMLQSTESSMQGLVELMNQQIAAIMTKLLDGMK